MKLVCISDLHGLLHNLEEDGDILIIAGDICPATNHDIIFQREWLENECKPWLQEMRKKFGHILFTPGNHDFIFEPASLHYKMLRPVIDFVPVLPWTVLIDEAIEIMGVKFYGTPWTNQYYNWAFMREETALSFIFSDIPDDTQVLISHGPPHGIGDRAARGKRGGSTSLLARIKELKELKACIFGHIHEGKRKVLDYPGNLCYNVSLLDDRYESVFEPTILEI